MLLRSVLAAAATVMLTITVLPSSAPGAEPPRRGFGARRPPVVSPEVSSDRRVTFRVRAPEAKAVRLNASDIPGLGRGAELEKGEEGVWEATVGPIDPGAYRYRFDVDGVLVVDPQNPATSESNNNAWSLVYVPGSEVTDARDVPHGAVAEVTYFSKSLGRFRRMHVYTPPGYESGTDKYPVFYLLHGASDSDDSWTSVGRAGFIMDNLIAEKKAKPMLVVMPAGHTGRFGFGRPRSGSRPAVDEFTQDFLGEVMPLVEKNYRVHADQEHRAIAGLSMGGGQTLNIAIRNLDKFAYMGVFSSGVFGITRRGPDAGDRPTWQQQHQETLDNAELKKGVKLVWFATGKEDFLIETSRATVGMLKKHGFDVIYKETSGGHTWINWRQYLPQFAQLLFGNKDLAAARREAARQASSEARAAASPAPPEGFDVVGENVPRGQIETIEYDSKSIGMKRKMVVYTPAGYSDDREYPVLYLLHGIGDDEDDWCQKGSANVILDNLHASKKVSTPRWTR